MYKMNERKLLRTTKDEVINYLNRMYDMTENNNYKIISSLYTDNTKKEFIEWFAILFCFLHDEMLAGSDQDYKIFLPYLNFATHFELISCEFWHEIEEETNRFRCGRTL